MFFISRFLFLTLITFNFTSSIMADDRPDLTGLKTLAITGLPGKVVVWGKDAFPLVVGGEEGKQSIIVAGSTLGKGRIIAYAHNGYGSNEVLSKNDTGKLLVRCIEWSSGKKIPPAKPLKVVVIGGDSQDYLISEKFDARPLGNNKLADALKLVDVVCIWNQKLSTDEEKVLRGFIAKGGGLICGMTPWGWKMLNPNQSLEDQPLNKILHSTGMSFIDGTTERSISDGFKIEKFEESLFNGSTALDLLEQLNQKKTTANSPQLIQAGNTLREITREIPADDRVLKPRLQKLLASREDKLIPTEKNPIRQNMPLEKVLLAYQIANIQSLPAKSVKPHPAADDFPGSVPSNAKEVSKTISVNINQPDWHSTGLYAPPGKVITVELAEKELKAGYSIRIGCHKDKNWDHKDWKRVPEISFEWPLNTRTTEVANPFGGTVYIVVPKQKNKSSSSQEVPFKISGAVEAPLFILGKTTKEEWLKSRQTPGPWAELITTKIGISVPSEAIRNLDDPEALMNYWDKISDAVNDLAAIPHDRERPERYVPDREISVGYMHSGYPIMTHMDVVDDLCLLYKLQKGSWGLFHEIGHNHQVRDWTFEGTGEVTCNLFALYVIETVCDPGSKKHEALDKYEKMVKEYVNQGSSFAKWKSDPFLALCMYIQLEEAFGWETFKKVFAEYRDLPINERPNNDDEAHDQWMVRFSKNCGKNLGPFFQAWGIPTSQAARDSIKNLPVWMPEDWNRITGK